MNAHRRSMLQEAVCAWVVTTKTDQPATRREFLASALGLTPFPRWRTDGVAEAAVSVWDIEAQGLTIDNAGHVAAGVHRHAGGRRQSHHRRHP